MEPGDSRLRGSILLAMGTAEMRAGRLEAGRGTLSKAADLGRRLDDTELLARAALRSAPWGLATAMIDEEGLIPLLEETLERLPPTASALRARVLARLAASLYWSAPPDRRGALAEEAIAMARQVDDAATLALVLSDAHLATWDPWRSPPIRGASRCCSSSASWQTWTSRSRRSRAPRNGFSSRAGRSPAIFTAVREP
jgi:hypothetical protein